jgi:NAD(P)-dependent dehydrogenase (short-subunit alcohol dehydrogenase family)
MGLAGRVALITGASRGIGLGMAQAFAAKGMAVVLNDVRHEVVSVAETMRGEGHRAIGIVADVRSKADVEAMVERTESELGPLWLLVNNAGALTFGPTEEMSEEDWDLAMDVDAKGVFLCSQAAIRRMIPRGEGRIVNVTSIAAVVVRTGQIGYCSAKAAINHFTRCLAVEMAGHGITVNAIMPGMTRTEMLVDSFAARGMSLNAMLNLIPAGRFALPADHAALVAWLASEEAQHVTGQLISVDGGQSQLLPLLGEVPAEPTPAPRVPQ